MTVFVSPVHVRLQLALEAVGLRKRYEQWAIALVETIAATQAQHPQWEATIWGFGGVNTYTTEIVSNGNIEHPQYFFDSSHYTTEVADLMDDAVRNILTRLPTFGVQLGVHNIRSVMATEREDLGQFSVKTLEIVADLENMIPEVRTPAF